MMLDGKANISVALNPAEIVKLIDLADELEGARDWPTVLNTARVLLVSALESWDEEGE
jgi:hypothetical protein